MTVKAAFLDRDGVINIDHAYVHRPQEFDWIDGVFEGCRQLVRAGYLLIVVTNQSGIGRGYYSEADFHALTDWMKQQFEKAGAPISGVYFCPHHPQKALGTYKQDCPCRKPAPGMLLKAQLDFDIDMQQSLMIGDKNSDMLAAKAAGVPVRILVGKDGLAEPAKSPECTQTARNLLTAVQSFLAKHEHKTSGSGL